MDDLWVFNFIECTDFVVPDIVEVENFNSPDSLCLSLSLSICQRMRKEELNSSDIFSFSIVLFMIYGLNILFFWKH